MIPKKEFVKLRKAVLQYLKINSDATGYCHIVHSSLENISRYSKEMYPFAKMSAAQKEEATNIFWDCLVQAGQVKVTSAPVTLSGKEENHYYLPGTQPFNQAAIPLLLEVRRQNEQR